MDAYKISVIIPTYNSGYFLKTVFDSIKLQTIGFDNIEVIFVDDNSNDNETLELLTDYNNNYSNVKSIFLENNSGFPGTPRNVGLSVASADFVIFSDHDDTYENNAFEVMYNEITSQNADIVISNYYKVLEDKKEKVETLFKGKTIAINSINENPRILEIGPSIWTNLFRREFLLSNSIKFLEGMLAEDLYVYTYSLLKSSKTIYLDSFYGYNYNIRDNGEDKSTIHIRNKKYLGKMIEGYFKTYELLKNQNKEQFFSNIFKNHLVYWLTSFINSDISDDDKKELIAAINPLLKKQIAITPNFDEKSFSSLNTPILNNDYDKIVKYVKRIKLLRRIKRFIKKLFGR